MSLKGLLDASPEAANCCLRVVHRHGAQGPEICRPRWLWRGDTPNLSQSSGVGFWKLSNPEATPSFWFPCQLNFQKKKNQKPICVSNIVPWKSRRPQNCMECQIPPPHACSRAKGLGHAPVIYESLSNDWRISRIFEAKRPASSSSSSSSSLPATATKRSRQGKNMRASCHRSVFEITLKTLHSTGTYSKKTR